MTRILIGSTLDTDKRDWESRHDYGGFLKFKNPIEQIWQQDGEVKALALALP